MRREEVVPLWVFWSKSFDWDCCWPGAIGRSSKPRLPGEIRVKGWVVSWTRDGVSLRCKRSGWTASNCQLELEGFLFTRSLRGEGMFEWADTQSLQIVHYMLLHGESTFTFNGHVHRHTKVLNVSDHK